MREVGTSIHDIVSTLGVSCDVVRMVTRKFETEGILTARSSRFLKEIRKVDDLDQKWKVSSLVQAIRPLVITQNALIRHFEWRRTMEISLAQVMELAISGKHHPKPGFLLSPLLTVRCSGVESFWSLVGRLAQVDLGESCNREWRKRLARFQGCVRIASKETSWSKPCEMPSWVRALWRRLDVGFKF